MITIIHRQMLAISAIISPLKEFLDDLHLYIHLENNILYPKVLELRKRSNVELMGSKQINHGT